MKFIGIFDRSLQHSHLCIVVGAFADLLIVTLWLQYCVRSAQYAHGEGRHRMRVLIEGRTEV